jgi:hypothetical protein
LLYIVADYVESYTDVPELLDMLSAPKAAEREKIVYEEVFFSLFMTFH